MPPSLSAFLEWVLHSGPPEARSGAQHLRDRLSHRQPRLCQAHYSDGRPVADGVPKAEESRLIGRLDNAYAKVVKMASGGCCAQKCLGKLDKTRLVVQALCHQAEEFQSRKTEVSRAAKEHVVEDGQGNKVVAHRVQGVLVCATAFGVSRGVSAATVSRHRKGAKETDFVESRPHASRGVLRPTVGAQESAEWMEKFFGRFAQPFPHKATRSHQTGEGRTQHFLPSRLFSTFSSVYEEYKKACCETNKAPVSFNTFRRAWLSAHFEVGACVPIDSPQVCE